MASRGQTYLPASDQIAAVGLKARSIRTIVVDDMPEMLQTMSGILNQYPSLSIIGTASTGLEAIGLATTELPDLICMDVNMPEMNGLQAALEIKERLPRTKILIVSANDDPDIALAAMDVGADGFIPKGKIVEKMGWHIERLFGDYTVWNSLPRAFAVTATEV